MHTIHDVLQPVRHIFGGDSKYCDVKHVNMLLVLFPIIEDLWIFKDVQITNVCFVKFDKWQN
jgi:hypothetical protein